MRPKFNSGRGILNYSGCIWILFFQNISIKGSITTTIIITIIIITFIVIKSIISSNN